MAFNTNIGTAWISVVPETKRIAGELDKALQKAERGISGEGIGKKLASGIGKTLAAGVATAGVAAGGVLAVSITKGLGRLTGIENAQAKLSGLGHEAEGVASIMDDALASVKGTAFGLEDAATIAASAVAAGVKPGADLQRTLKLTGDAATIAGTDLSTMGSIINKVATSDMMQMDVANQLMDAGIPILQMVAEQLGVTAEEARKMASDGEISFEIFQTALEDGLGGAALKSGETVQGAFANMVAAAGRFGAKLADPAFKAAPAIFSSIGTVFDEVNDAITPATEKIGEILTPALESLATIIETRVAPWMGEMAGKVGDLAAIGLEKVLDPDSWSHVADIFGKVRDVAVELWPSIESLATSFLSISQNISVATWEALTSVLEAVAPLIESVLVPLVEKIAEFAEQNPGAVEAMVWAFLGFKAVGAVAGPVATFAGALGNLGGAFSTVSTLVGAGGVVEGIKEVGKYSKDSNPILAKMGKTVGGTGKVAGTAGKIFGKLGKVFMTVIRFVNPWVAGITIVAGALTWFFTQTELGQEIVEKVTEAIVKAWGWVKEKFGEAIDWITDKFEAFTGWISDAWNGIVDLFKGDYTSAFRDAFGIEEDNPLILTFFKVRDFLIEIPKLVKGVTDILFKGDFTGLPFGLEEDSGFVKFLFGLRDVVVDTGKIITDVFQWIFDAVQITLGIIGTIVLTPLILAWNLLSWAIKGAWENVIKPAWDAMSGAAVALWEGYISPALQAISAGWDWLSGRMSAIWEAIKTAVFLAWQSYVDTLRGHWETFTSIISAAWQKVSDFFTSVWNTIKTAVFDAWSWYVTTLQNNWNTFTGALNTAWTWLKDILIGVWNQIKSAVFDVFTAVIDALRPHFETAMGVMSGAWNVLRDGLNAGWNFIRDNVFSPLRSGLDTLRDSFSNVVDRIGQIWAGLKSKLASPINWVIDKVINGGVFRAWDTMAEFLPGLSKSKPLAGIPEHATGGAIRGPGSGTSDDVLMWGSNGEHMLTAAEVKAFGGHEHIYRLRNLLRNRVPFTTDGKGGILPLPRGIDNTLGDLAGAAPDLLPKYRDGGEIRPAWESQLQAAHQFARAQHGKPYQWAGPTGPGSSFDCSGFMGSIAAVIQGTNPWQRYWATGAFPTPGAQGFAPGLGRGFSIGVWNGGPYGGHTSGTLSAVPGFSTTNVESGGSPSMVKYGPGAAGADDPQHKMRFHLPIGADGAFESGGSGGSIFDLLGGIKSWFTSKFDAIFNPIKEMLPSPPPEWDGIPPEMFTGGVKGIKDFAKEKIEGLGDLTSAVWAKLTDFDFDLFDTGGVWKPGRVGLNLSGKNEYVFTNRAMRDFQQATESLQVVAKEIGAAFEGGDWGYGELKSYIGEDLARAVVEGVAHLGAVVRPYMPAAQENADLYLHGQADSALGMVGLGGARELVEGIQSRVHSIATSDEVKEGLRTVKLDPNLDYRGAEIMRKLEELGIKVEQIEDDLGGSVLGGIHTMA